MTVLSIALKLRGVMASVMTNGLKFTAVFSTLDQVWDQQIMKQWLDYATVVGLLQKYQKCRMKK